MKYLFLLGCSLAVVSPAWADGKKPPLQDAALPCGEWTSDCEAGLGQRGVSDSEITVTATGLWSRRSDSGQSIAVITAQDLATIQGADPIRGIERLPGVSLARSGGLGSQTSLFVRGANSEQLLVTIDGIRMDDTAAPSGGFDLGTLLARGIGRIELLRGSNSLAWGSNAIGGVLAISSDTRPGARGTLEYGAHDTIDASAGFGLSGQRASLALNGGYLSSDGISAFAGGTEPDAFRQWQVSGQGSLNLGANFSINAAGRYADSRVGFDGYPAPTYSVFSDTPEYQTTRQGAGRVGLDYDGDGFELSSGLALSDTRRAYFDPTYGSAPNFETSGRSVHVNLTGRADLTDSVQLDFGADGDWSRYATTFDPHQSARAIGGHVLLGYHTNAVHLTGGGRIDDHDRFGRHATFGANGSWALGGNWRLRASWGQGFKAPTLSQLYGYGANPGLEPETSEAFDAGLEYGSSDGKGHFAATLFRRDSTNLIDYVFPTGYFNIGRARAQGFELAGAAQVSDNFSVRAAYTFLDATNRATGKQLARRPRHALSASLDWTTPLASLALGADARLVGDSFDDAGNFTVIDGHALLTLRASLPLGDRIALYGRIENVTDARYETVKGYGAYGRSAYAGVRLTW